MPADLHTEHLSIEESVAPGDQVNVAFTVTNRGDAESDGEGHIKVEVLGPDHAPVHKGEIANAKVGAGHEQHHVHAFNAPETPGEHEVHVFVPHASGKAAGTFTVSG